MSNDYLDNNQAYRTDQKQSHSNSYANVILGSLDDKLNQELNINFKNSNSNVNKYDGAYSSSSALSSSEEKIFHDDFLNNNKKISMPHSEHSIYYEEQIEETFSSSTQLTTMKTTTTTTTLKKEKLSSNHQEMQVDDETNEQSKLNTFVQLSTKQSSDKQNQDQVYDNLTSLQINKKETAHGSADANLRNIVNQIRNAEVYHANPIQKNDSDVEEETNMHLKNIIRDIKETDEYERLLANKQSQQQEKQLITGLNFNVKNTYKEERQSAKTENDRIHAYQSTKILPQFSERQIEIQITPDLSNSSKEVKDLTNQSEKQVTALSSTQIKYEIPVENQNLKNIILDIKEMDLVDKKFAAVELEKKNLAKSNSNANSVSTDDVKIEKKSVEDEDNQLSYLRYMIAEAIHTDKSDRKTPKSNGSISATLSNASSIASNISSNSTTYNSYKQSSHLQKEVEYMENKYSSSTYEEDSLKQSIHFTDVFGDLSAHSALEDSLSKQSQYQSSSSKNQQHLHESRPLPTASESAKTPSSLQQIVIDIHSIDAQNKPPQSQKSSFNQSQLSNSQTSLGINKSSDSQSSLSNFIGETVLTDSRAHHELINQKRLPANSNIVNIMDEAIETDIYKQRIDEESGEETTSSLSNRTNQENLNLFNIMGEAVLTDVHSQQKNQSNLMSIQKQANLFDIIEEAVLTDNYMHSLEVNQEHFSSSKMHSEISSSSSSSQLNVYKYGESTSNNDKPSEEFSFPQLPRKLSDSTMNNLYNIMAEAVGQQKPATSSDDLQPIPSLSEIVVEILTHDGNPRVEYKPQKDAQKPQIQEQASTSSQQELIVDLKRPNPYLYYIMAEALAANGYQPPQQQSKPLNLTPSEMNLLVGQDSGLGVLRMTVHYDELRTRLSITFHEARNLKNESSSKSSKDDSKNIIDPYVKVVLSPDEKPSLKRKTKIVKNNVNPIWQETFDYSMTQNQALNKELKAIVKIERGLFDSKESRFLGEIQLKLNELDILQPFTRWYFLQTVSKSSLKEK